METTDIIYNQDAAVVQANELVRSKQDDLTLLEAKLIRLAVSQVLKDDTDLKTYSCNVSELATFLKISPDNIYRDIQNIANTFIRKCIFISIPNKRKPNEPNYKIFHWIDYFEYSNGTITFRLSDNLKPYLIGLNKLFTLYPYNAILMLPTYYSIRLYELIASYENLLLSEHIEHYDNIHIDSDEVVFTIYSLRHYFNCVDKYPNTGKFIDRVIEPSIEAVAKHAEMYLSYRTITKGKKITHIVFKKIPAVDYFLNKLRTQKKQ
jgi:plasmid replication initiation protein